MAGGNFFSAVWISYHVVDVCQGNIPKSLGSSERNP